MALWSSGMIPPSGNKRALERTVQNVGEAPISIIGKAQLFFLRCLYATVFMPRQKRSTNSFLSDIKKRILPSRANRQQT